MLGMGTAVPPTTIDQVDAADIAINLCCRTPEHRTWLPLMYQQTGIRTRHMQFNATVVRDLKTGSRDSGSCFLPTGIDEDAGPTTGERMELYRRAAAALAENAMEAALQSAGIEPDVITHLVTVSCTGFHAPGFDLELMHRLPLNAGVARTHIGFMGCHGALNALRVGRAFAGADPAARILISATEVVQPPLSLRLGPAKNGRQRHLRRWLGCPGRAALDPVRDAWRVISCGSYVFPNSEDAMTWTVGDHGFEMTLAKSVPGLIAAHLRPWLSRWLGGQGIAVERVGGWAVHPGGPRILEAVEDALGLFRRRPTSLVRCSLTMATCRRRRCYSFSND